VEGEKGRKAGGESKGGVRGREGREGIPLSEILNTPLW